MPVNPFYEPHDDQLLNKLDPRWDPDYERGYRIGARHRAAFLRGRAAVVDFFQTTFGQFLVCLLIVLAIWDVACRTVGCP